MNIRNLSEIYMKSMNNPNSREIKFNIRCIEKAVRKSLNKPMGSITETDMQKIKYLYFDVNCKFAIELSLNEPPIPFQDDRGGDEWDCCCAYGDEIPSFIMNNYSSINREDNRYPSSDYKERKSFLENLKFFNSEGLSKEEYLEEQRSFRQQIDTSFSIFAALVNKKQNEYRERTGEPLTPEIRQQIEREAKDELYNNRTTATTSKKEIQEEQDLTELPSTYFEEDLGKFKGLKVLRMGELGIENYEFLKSLSSLEVLEINDYPYPKNIDQYCKNLKQLCIWCD